jgi:hypothetical protein
MSAKIFRGANKLDADAFEKPYLSPFTDPAFEPLRAELKAIVSAAWDAYSDGRKKATAHPEGTRAGTTERVEQDAYEADRQRPMTSVHKADEMDSKPRSRVPNTGHSVARRPSIR